MPDCDLCGYPEAEALKVFEGWVRICTECKPDYLDLVQNSQNSPLLKVADIQEAFTYLDELRLSGRTNMYGAAEYLEDEWAPDYYEEGGELKNSDARKLMFLWMHSFGRRSGAREASG